MIDCPTQLFIGNQWSEAQSGETFETVDPSTEAVISTVARAGEADVDRAARAAHDAMKGPWSRHASIHRPNYRCHSYR